MKILQVISAVGPKFGGPSTGSVAINRELHRMGINAVIVSTDAGDLSRRSMDSDEVKAVLNSSSNVELHQISWPRSLCSSFSLVRGIFKQAKAANFMIIHGSYQLPPIYAYLAAKLTGTPYAFQPHGIMEPYIRRQSARKKAIFDFLIGKSLVRYARFVIFASSLEAENAKDLVPIHQRFISPLGIVVEDTSMEVTELKDCFSTVPYGARFLYLSRLAKKKNPLILLEAWSTSKAKDVAHLVIAGPDDDYSQKDLREIVDERGITDSVSIVGPRFGPQKRWLFENCAYFVLPSSNENFGIVVGEAMSLGCRVVAGPEVAAVWHAVDAGGGYVFSDVTVEEVSRTLDQRIAAEVPSGPSADLVTYSTEQLSWRRFCTRLLERIRLEIG